MEFCNLAMWSGSLGGMQSSIIWFNASHFKETQVKFDYDFKIKI
jgi:hypothetical protein